MGDRTSDTTSQMFNYTHTYIHIFHYTLHTYTQYYQYIHNWIVFDFVSQKIYLILMTYSWSSPFGRWWKRWRYFFSYFLSLFHFFFLLLFCCSCLYALAFCVYKITMLKIKSSARNETSAKILYTNTTNYRTAFCIQIYTYIRYIVYISNWNIRLLPRTINVRVIYSHCL